MATAAHSAVEQSPTAEQSGVFSTFDAACSGPESVTVELLSPVHGIFIDSSATVAVRMQAASRLKEVAKKYPVEAEMATFNGKLYVSRNPGPGRTHARTHCPRHTASAR